MSLIFFMDESGHDHKTMPYEIRGGFVVHAKDLWKLILSVQEKELAAFGVEIKRYNQELKGCKLLDKRKIKFSQQAPPFDLQKRKDLCKSFFEKGLNKINPSFEEFTAYGQACSFFAKGVFQLLEKYDAKIFATAVPREIEQPGTYSETFLRKDHVFLFERFYYFLLQKEEDGLIVMDEVEKKDDLRFVKRMEEYFQRTKNGRQRAKSITPVPFFVSSDMSYPVQIADIVIYCINCCFREDRMQAEKREGNVWITIERKIKNLQQIMECANARGGIVPTKSIVYVEDLYTSR